MAAAAASSAMEGREGGGGQNNGGGGEVLVKGEGRGGGVEDGNAAGRKMKSLALLCKKQARNIFICILLFCDVL